MSDYDYDLLVIGAGSGGVRASRVAAGLGARVAVVESRYLGGTCVNVGCVPKKLFVYGSHFSEELAGAAGFGWQAPSTGFDWPTLRDNKTAEIQRLNGIYQSLLETSGVSIINGHGKIMSPHEVEVAGQCYSCRYILVATGGWPFVPEFPGREHVISSNEAFYLDELPESIAIVGGGYIAVEFAGIFHGLGVETHLIYRRELFLRGFDEGIRQHMKQELEKKGIHLYFNTNVDSIEKEPGDYKINCGETSLRTDQVMYATGRKPLTENLGLENTRVSLNQSGEIEVDDNYQTAESSVYSLGDVTGGIELTPVAIAEGTALAQQLFGDPQPVDYRNIPTAIFSQPNIGTVGLTEAEAKKQFQKTRVYETRFRHLKHTLSGLDEKTFMKLIVDDATDRVVGCHMAGMEAGEIIQGLAVAIKAGATKKIFDETIGIHPTAAEEFVTMKTERA